MFTHNLAAVNGIRLHYVAAGSGPAIVFLHGHPDFWYLWNEQLNHFRGTHTVIAPDLRGYNRSDKPPAVVDYRLPLVVDDIRALVEQLGVAPITLVGHDWGAVVAWELAARYPHLISRLIAFSTPPLDVLRRALRDPQQRLHATYQLMLTSPQAEGILAAGSYYLYRLTVFGAAAEGPTGSFSEDDRQAYLTAWSQPGVLQASCHYYRAANFLDYFGEVERQTFLDGWREPSWPGEERHFYQGLRTADVWGAPRPLPADDLHDDACGARITVPTLFVYGENEEFVVSDDAWFEERVAHGSRMCVPGAGHRIIHEHAALATEQIGTFVTR